MGGDRDMTGQDPMSSTAEGDDDPGSAALGEAGTEEGRRGTEDEASSTPTPPPEAFDDTPVTDAVPEENLGFPEG
ncbi:hypothetical protein [Aquipuribacter sp. MA13-6]|uniref:hypothetical protein n=1 Tax=unclassified Aquipuribacter TaxID=2635084 RepID=UPI003EED8748